MCGFAAIFDTKPGNALPEETANRIITSLLHRGPDGTGQKHFQNQQGNISLFHTRLAIIDPLPRSDQPLSDTHDNHIVFNGEIYNYQDLAEPLADLEIMQSDTQVLLSLYDKYGPDMVHHLRGMYAFVIWDGIKQRAFAARDAFGIKPLYLAQYGSSTVFASEVSTVLATGKIPKEPCESGICEYFRWGSCQGHNLPLKHITRVEPGASLLWENGKLTPGPQRLPFSNTSGTLEDTGSTTRAAFIDSVESHLVSDVPVATFLSSGIDSVATLAAAQLSGAESIPSFTLSFPGTGLDEAAQASKFAARFNSPHTAIKLESEQLTETFDSFITSQDLPGIDGFNTYCISQAVASHGYKVVLSGLGGDEILGGYPTFLQVPRLLKIRKYLQWLTPLLSGYHVAEVTASQRRLSRALEFINSSGGIGHAYETSRCLFSQHEMYQLQKHFGFKTHSLERENATIHSELKQDEQISIFEVQHYLNHQLLRDTDNYSMSHGLEIRVPFLDVPLWQTLCSLQPKHRFEASKYLMQRAFPELPDMLFKQQKRGFGLPWNDWISSSLKEHFRVADALPLKYPPTWYQSLSMVSFHAWCQRHNLDLTGPS
ncbi:MAG: asparagine synthase (glutamine-hydrolyzing) [Verrucomicrobiota bacterium]